jgi:phosphatidylglycerophosphate synthase
MAGLRQARLWTPANALTALRFIAALPLYHAIENGSWAIAFAIFWVAVASDLVDGRIARARGESSALGGLLDHGTDAIFVVSGLCALANSGQTPWILPYLVAAAFLQYVLDSKTLAGRPLRTSRVGRWNGILYFVPIGTLVTRETLSIGIPPDRFLFWIGVGLALTTLMSMADRAWALIESRRDDRRSSSSSS